MLATGAVSVISPYFALKSRTVLTWSFLILLFDLHKTLTTHSQTQTQDDMLFKLTLPFTGCI